MRRQFTKRYSLQVSVCVLRGLPDQLSTHPSIFHEGKHLESRGQFEENIATKNRLTLILSELKCFVVNDSWC